MKGNKKLWGGAFQEPLSELAWKFGQSIETDKHFLVEELDVSAAHAEMLGKTGALTAGESSKLQKCLQKLRKQAVSGKLVLPSDAEDVHSAIEDELVSELGDVGAKLHMGRSRNDQIASVARLWVMRRSAELQDQIKSLQEVILNLAQAHATVAMPGFTHQQRAQPITLGFHLLSYFWMLQRDGVRLSSLFEMCSSLPLGSAALAGTPIPIDRDFTAKTLGFDAPTPSALDGVSDRDFVGDALHACSMVMQHLSRVSQELVLWSGSEFNWVTLADSVSTGSSIMPQKRNPDFAELIRGHIGTVIGHWVAYQTMMKALPLGYNRDQQLDKPPLVASFSIALHSVGLVSEMLRRAKFNTARMADDAGSQFSTATAVADALAMDGVPFRHAHEIVGKLVLECRRRGIGLNEFPTADLKMISKSLKSEHLCFADTPRSIESRNSKGGPAKRAVQAQLKSAEKLHRAKGFKTIH